MKQYRDMVLEPEAVDKFQHVLTDYIGGAALPLRQARADILQEPAKRRKNGKSRLRLPTSPPVGQMTSHARKSTKRSHPTIFESFDQRSFFLPAPKVETRSPGRGERKIPLLVNDWTAQAKWFSEAFKAVQQVGCRTIAKVWIKKIHPKKVSGHTVLKVVAKHSSNRLIHTMAVCLETCPTTPIAPGPLTGLPGASDNVAAGP